MQRSGRDRLGVDLRHGRLFLGRAFESYAKPVGIAALLCAIIGFFVGGRFVRYHEKQLEDEAERAFPGPLVQPKG